VILVARRAERLQSLAADLPGTAHVVAHDLAADAAGLKPKIDELGLDVDLLVNNAGFGTFGHFTDIDAARDAEQIRLNCEAVVTLSHAFLPAMLDRGGGGIIVVASTAGYQPIPYEAVYSASKAFALRFTEALWEELRDTGVRVLAVNPGPVPTEWQEVAGHDDALGRIPPPVSAEQCVAESLDAYDSGRRSIIPGRGMRWFMRLTQPSSRGIQLRVTERMYRPERGRLSNRRR
jgi:short-subunit dehydrogenase